MIGFEGLRRDIIWAFIKRILFAEVIVLVMIFGLPFFLDPLMGAKTPMWEFFWKVEIGVHICFALVIVITYVGHKLGILE